MVAVLGVMALMVSVTGGTALLVRAAFDGVQGKGDSLKLDALVRAGIELAGYELYVLKLPPERIEAQQVRLDDGTITLFAEDESGKIDLNWSDPVLLSRAYQMSGLRSLQPSEFAARALIWRDRYEEKDRNGAARAAPPGQGNPETRKKEGFRTISELQWVPGVSAADAAILAPFLTVHNAQGKVNVLAAAPATLQALPDMTPALAAQIFALRASRSPATSAQIIQLVQKQQSFVTALPGRSFRVRVEARAGAAAARVVEVTLVRAPPKEAPYFVTEWSYRRE